MFLHFSQFRLWFDPMMRNVTDDSLLHRQPRRSWLWWWSSASPGCPTTSCTCGSSSARSP